MTKGNKTRRAWHLLALLLAALMTILPHHGVAPAGASSGNHGAQIVEATSPCDDHDCGQRLALCCAMGMCLGSPPEPVIAAERMSYATRYHAALSTTLPLWISAGPDRPPKSV